MPIIASLLPAIASLHSILWLILQLSPEYFRLAVNECYSANLPWTYNVIDAAPKIGVQKVIFASSETIYGICFAMGN